MAATKSVTSIWSSESFVASTPHAASSAITLNGYGAGINIKITNGATGPTVALALQIQVSNDNTNFYDFGGPLSGNITNSGVVSYGDIEIPMNNKYVKIIPYTTNTGQNVTVDADICETTAL